MSRTQYDSERQAAALRDDRDVARPQRGVGATAERDRYIVVHIHDAYAVGARHPHAIALRDRFKLPGKDLSFPALPLEPGRQNVSGRYPFLTALFNGRGNQPGRDGNQRQVDLARDGGDILIGRQLADCLAVRVNRINLAGVTVPPEDSERPAGDGVRVT